MTKKTIAAICRKKWGTKQPIRLREDKSAPLTADRQAIREQITALKAEKDAVGKLMTADQSTHWPALLKAAEFVVDVTGDPPSIEQLATAVHRTRQWCNHHNHYNVLTKEIKELTSKLHRYRWTVSRDDYTGPIPLEFVEAQADTLDELAVKIKEAK